MTFLSIFFSFPLWLLWFRSQFPPHFRTAVMEKTLESPLASKDVKLINLKGNQSWILIGRTDAEASIFWPPDANSWLIGKKPWCWERLKAEEDMTEDEMVGWHHWCTGHELGQTLGDGEGQRSLTCCSSWGHEELETTWRLNKQQETYNAILPSGKGSGNPLLYSCLENSMDRGAWQATVHGVAKSQTQWSS